MVVYELGHKVDGAHTNTGNELTYKEGALDQGRFIFSEHLSNLGKELIDIIAEY